MNRYESIDCPVCKKPLNNGDDIVVCPECGAPYHKSCYLKEGSCIFGGLHEKGEAWEAPKPEGKYDGEASRRCSRCGSVNSPTASFCEVCGTPLANYIPVPQQNQGASTNLPPRPNQFPQYGEIPPKAMPLNPYTTPFGGVSPDEEIDGVPAKDLAVFIGRNTHYFLPRFKAYTRSKAKTINWSGFIFQGGYFLYRKMYTPAILLILLQFLFSIPNALYQYFLFTTDTSFASASDASYLSSLVTISWICTGLSMAMRLFCGFMANVLYLKHCKKKILAEKAVTRTEKDYFAVLSKKGSVATALITGLLIGYAVINVISMYLLILLL